ncbi:protein NO VEIN domain-containing protein [Streptomyces sp. NPDC058623]|uniref:protein NO VEIN domain-containing protein n=1 Tax=Streptomyces sp. NPDC058623 TaxID=3346563 RepID=UPI0036619EF4
MNAFEVEQLAMSLAIRYEQDQGRQVSDVSNGWHLEDLSDFKQWSQSRRDRHAPRPTCDLLSRNPDGSIARLIEVKGRGGPTSVSVPDRQRGAMFGYGSDWWLYVALDCRTPTPRLIVVREPARMLWKHMPSPTAAGPYGSPRVRDEGTWHVGRDQILEFGEAILP